jgi:hypothetical protein
MFVRTVGWIACSIVLGMYSQGCGDDADGGGDSGPRADGKDAARDDAAAAPEADAGHDEDGGAAAGTTRWVGEVEGSDVRLGVVMDGGARARVFFCGGPSSFATSTRWLIADVKSGGAFSFDDMGWRVSGEVAMDRVTGELAIGDEAGRAFSARPVQKGTLAGLYEGQSECGRVGLIVLHDSPTSAARGQGACVGPGHPPEQVSPILPITLEAGGIQVEIGAVRAEVRAAGLTPAP